MTDMTLGGVFNKTRAADCKASGDYTSVILAFCSFHYALHSIFLRPGTL